jgi:hypothetical protein
MPCTAKGHRITSSATQQAYERSKARKAGGQSLLSPRAASAYTGYTRETLREWRLHGCPWLGGRRLKTRLFPDGFGALTRYYLATELDELLGNAGQCPENWISLRRAAVAYRWSRATLWNWIRDGCPLLAGRKPDHRSQLIGSTGNQARVNCLLWKPDLELIQQRRGQDDRAPGECSTGQAARKFHVSTSTARNWCAHAALTDPSGRLVRRGEVNCNGARKLAWILTEEGQREFKRRLTAPADLPHIDEQERIWFPLALVKKHYPRLSAHTLHAFANRPCHYLEGDILHAKEIALNKRKCRWATQWYWLEDDLKRMAPPRSGRPRKARPGHGANSPTWKAPVAAAKGDEYPGHQRKPYTTGRPPDPDVEAGLRYCYDEYVAGRKSRAQVYEAARQRFGAHAPASPEDVKSKARRWAHRFDPPLPMTR